MASNPTREALLARGALLLAATAVLAACSASDGDTAGTSTSGEAATTSTARPPAVAYPGEEWAVASPAELGFRPASLTALAAQAEAAGSSCLVVVRDGVVVIDERWPGPEPTPREAFSVTKSLTSTLVGIAVDRGELALDGSAAEHVPEWQGTAAEAVTVADLLANVSGRHWDLATDYRAMAAEAQDKTGFAIGLGQDDSPGTVWAYNNSAIQTLDAVLESATGETPQALALERVFGPLGMDDSEMSLDAAGNTLTFMGLQTTCLDLARYGHLMLNEGRWEDQQVVSEAFVVAATGRSSSELNAAYGYLWWLNREGIVGSPGLATGGGEATPAESQLLRAAPDDVFWALGFNDQVVAVIPSEGIVAVRLGAKPPAEAPFGFSELTTGVLDAVAP